MKTKRTGYARLPLHSGKAPRWLFGRMVQLAREIIIYIVSEYGSDEVLRRLSDAYWFQAFGCVLGFDWHSSGLTTTTCGAIKEGIRGLEKDLSLFAAGGKGSVSRKTPYQIQSICEFLSRNPEPLIYASRMSAKIDNCCLQDGYQLYHHSFFFTSGGKWCVVQQGMNDKNKTARRYHWLGENVKRFVEEPHSAVCCDKRLPVLNLVAKESEDTRKISTKIAAEPVDKTLKVFERVPELILPDRHYITRDDINPTYLKKILLKTYQSSPSDYSELLSIRGVGAKTLRALALISELIYGKAPSFRDPARFSFAHGGKDGIPYPVDRELYDKSIELLEKALKKSNVVRTEKIKAFKRLSIIQRRR